MERKNFFVSAKADKNDNTMCASVTLPSPLALNEKYEMALMFCSFNPVWNVVDNLYMVYTSDEGSEEIQLDDIFSADPATFVDNISDRLVEMYGSDMRESRCKVKITTADQGYLIKLQKLSSLLFSSNLARLLNLPTRLQNDDKAKNKSLRFVPAKDQFPKIIDNYVISCDEIESNHISRIGHAGQILHFIHTPASQHGQPVYLFPRTQIYQPMKEDSLLHTIHIRLLNDVGEQIFVKLPELYVHLHIRQRSQ